MFFVTVYSMSLLFRVIILLEKRKMVVSLLRVVCSGRVFGWERQREFHVAPQLL